MVVAASKETLSFQTEVKQLLHLMIHSLYSNKEIFLRELVSNSSDALDKLRFEALSNNDLYENNSDLKITVDFDKEARTITIKDNGIGMSRDEVINNLGTIAKSGTKEFLAKLSGDNAKDAKLIGQFGVGFYSAFIVADKVSVSTRRAGLAADDAVLWTSAGEGDYTLENISKAERGTEIRLHLKQDEDEFLDAWRLRNIISTYSDHISFPVEMKKTQAPGEEESDKELGFEVVNKAQALWTRSKSDIKDEEYQEFYKHISHDFEDALCWSHNRVEGKHEYTSLLYIPQRAQFDLYNREKRYGVKLYVQRVFIMDDAEQFMPAYMRFVRGVIDSNDLPLNISREILQNNRLVESIKSANVKKVLSSLERLSKDEEKYQTFWSNFGEVLKEGPAEDYANREQIAKLLRFATTYKDEEAQTVSLDTYIDRMQEQQDKIYYVTGETFAAAKSSPHLEIFRKKGIEVLLLSDRVDEWLTAHLEEYKGKKLQSIAKGELDLDELDSAEDKAKQEESEKAFAKLVERVTAVMGERVKEVRLTHRLTESPSCIVADTNDMGLQMQRILKSAGQDIPQSKPIFELNPEHVVVKRLDAEQNEQRFNDWTNILFDQAVLADGGQLDNPADFVKRINELFITAGLSA